jgi:hypothetical protein
LGGMNESGIGEERSEENESFWSRITRRVIHDLMGIDDDLLSTIFGEALPEDDTLFATPPSNATFQEIRSVLPTGQQYEQTSWEYRLLDRVARELGILVSHISDHPGAFSTYIQTQQVTLPYAGLPVIPESSRDSIPSDPQASASSLATPDFKPTLQVTQPISIPRPSTSLASPCSDLEDSTPRPINPLLQPKQFTREEWERDLDVKMVFRYLQQRFTSKFRSGPPSPSIPFSTRGTGHLATASTADSAARAARVRQHHPLVMRQSGEGVARRTIDRRTWKATVPGPSSPGAMYARRGSSNCASERLSAKNKRNSGSSRHYWDFGRGTNSVGSGSLITSTGGMGSWGEV